MANIIISTTIHPELHAKAKRANLKWSHALRFGIIKLLRMEEGGDLKETNAELKEMKETINNMTNTMQRHITARIELQKEVDKLKEITK